VFDRLLKTSTNSIDWSHKSGMDSDDASVTSSLASGKSGKSVKRSVPIRRESLLLRPTLSSAMKDKASDYEALVTATAASCGALPPPPVPVLSGSFLQRESASLGIKQHQQEGGGEGAGAEGEEGISATAHTTTPPSSPKRRSSLLMPTASSLMKDLQANPPPPQ
jgi:hypothetical protein